MATTCLHRMVITPLAWTLAHVFSDLRQGLAEAGRVALRDLNGGVVEHYLGFTMQDWASQEEWERALRGAFEHAESMKIEEVGAEKAADLTLKRHPAMMIGVMGNYRKIHHTLLRNRHRKKTMGPCYNSIQILLPPPMAGVAAYYCAADATGWRRPPGREVWPTWDEVR